jgi:hypothetical protein
MHACVHAFVSGVCNVCVHASVLAQACMHRVVCVFVYVCMCVLCVHVYVCVSSCVSL